MPIKRKLGLLLNNKGKLHVKSKDSCISDELFECGGAFHSNEYSHEKFSTTLIPISLIEQNNVDIVE